MEYNFFQISKIFSNCSNFQELADACDCFNYFANEMDDIKVAFIYAVAKNRFNELDNELKNSL